MSNKRLSRDQKRRQKLEKRARKSAPSVRLASAGGKYKRSEFVVPLMQTEIGICEAYVAGGRRLTDRDVEGSLEQLIGQLRTRNLAEIVSDADDAIPACDDPVCRMILRRWQGLHDTDSLPGRDDLVGILRTILGSQEVWRTHSGHSRGYLHYLEGFLGQAGVRVDWQVAAQAPEPDDLPADLLLETGRAWLAGDANAGIEFQARANECIGMRRPESVASACRQLLEDAPSPGEREREILEQLALQARQAPAPDRRRFAAGLTRTIAKLAGY